MTVVPARLHNMATRTLCITSGDQRSRCVDLVGLFNATTSSGSSVNSHVASLVDQLLLSLSSQNREACEQYLESLGWTRGKYANQFRSELTTTDFDHMRAYFRAAVIQYDDAYSPRPSVMPSGSPPAWSGGASHDGSGGVRVDKGSVDPDRQAFEDDLDQFMEGRNTPLTKKPMLRFKEVISGLDFFKP